MATRVLRPVHRRIGPFEQPPLGGAFRFVSRQADADGHTQPVLTTGHPDGSVQNLQQAPGGIDGDLLGPLGRDVEQDQEFITTVTSE